ncbi:MAG: 16S rRNA (guanine(966)-N(2))-methyltransferase RsmD [Steroidobacteraceae bacterium]
MSSPSQTHRRGGTARVLRIIGGAWRGRRLRFPAASAIRPTPDRVRETLFNWLAPAVHGARCLDLFAGSGALGLEALSRGAAHVTFVERDRRSARAIEECLAQWDVERRHDWRVVGADAEVFLAGPAQPFDIVFLDPPFASGVLAAVSARLEAGGWLAGAARIYLECPAGQHPQVPAAWAHERDKRSGQVGYHLYSRHRGIAAE